MIVLDPMLATGGSLISVVELLLARGAPTPITVVCALAAPEGIAALEAAGAVDPPVTAAIDDHLDERAFIVPGLGDAGDRQFGTPARRNDWCQTPIVTANHVIPSSLWCRPWDDYLESTTPAVGTT